MSNNSSNWRSLVNLFAYIAVIMIGTALLLSRILALFDVQAKVIGALLTIANVIAYIIVSISAFYYARTKRNIWYIILWVIAVVLIVVSYII